MLGAIIGDVAGSLYEVEEVLAYKKKEPISYESRIKILDKSVPLFREGSSYTDDTVLTCAIAECILNKGNYEEYLKKYGKKELDLGLDAYGRSRFGQGFVDWVLGNSTGNSFGNGCAMRVSAIPMYYDNPERILEETYKATITSHNHEESVKATKAVALAIHLAKNKASKYEIKRTIEIECGYNFDFDLENLQRTYTFSSKAASSVPQAIFCFLISNSFEDSIRKAISIGGDTDTIAAITGSVAESYYGIPKHIIKDVYNFIPDYVKNIVERFYYNLDFKEFLVENQMNDPNFLEYAEKVVWRTPSNQTKNWYRVFPNVDKDDVLIGFRFIVSEIHTREDLLVNIHEYTHAFDLYQELGSVYKENLEEKELRAKKLEKKYLSKEKRC